MLDVYQAAIRNITQLAPEKRIYFNTSHATSTIVAKHSTLARDLYVIYAGKDPDSDSRLSRCS